MKNVLVIEDNNDNMTLICDILQINGYAPITAETGLQGVQLAEQRLPDFIILDIQLPDIDGYHVLDKIRANGKTRKIPVIAMTSYAMAGDREKLLNAGCDAYLEKPIDPATVLEEIRRVISDAG